MNATQQKVDEIFTTLQKLEMAPTPNNVSIMSGVYMLLREVYAETGEKNERSETDPE